MTDLRRMFYNRYKTSSIFNTEAPPNVQMKDNISSKSNYQKIFDPKYDKMTSKERYWKEMRFNDSKNKTMRSLSIKEIRKKKELEEKRNNLNGAEIMCRDMFNGYDTKKYLLKRNKSTFYLRSYLTDFSLNDKSTKYERSLAYTCSNIFYDKEKDNQIQKSFRESKENKNWIKINNRRPYRILRKQKSWSDFEKELSQRKKRFSHSKFATDMDWKTTNTEDLRYSTESDIDSVLSEGWTSRKSYRRVNILRREYIGDKNNKKLEQNKESVKYNILSGRDRNDELSIKIYDKYNKYQPSVEFYEIDIPRNFDLTDINTIRNIFASRGIHAFKIEESSNYVNNKSGKITLRIRKNNIFDEKIYDKNINNIKKIISKKDMKLNKVEGNKAKASKIAKQRVKTPYKGEILLKPSDTQKNDKDKENKAKNQTTLKKKTINIKTKNTKKINSKIKSNKNIKVKK